MLSICGTDCCDRCSQKEACGGCIQTGGHPFGGSCVAAQQIQNGGMTEFLKFKNDLIREINALEIPALTVTDLNLLNGVYVNLEYCLPNGHKVKLLEDHKVYLGNQIDIPGSRFCYGVVGDEKYLLVCTYGYNGADPQIVCYQKRKNFGGKGAN